MINHLGKYNDAQAIQDALDAGTLANPYVAMTSAGTIDYNSLQPTPPAPAGIGVWTYNESGGYYTFKINGVNPEATMPYQDIDQYWSDQYIGTLEGVYCQGVMDLVIKLNYNTNDRTWNMMFNNEELSEIPVGSFEFGVPYIWESGVMTDPDESNSTICPDWDGVDTFTIPIAPGFLSPYNPPYPVGE